MYSDCESYDDYDDGYDDGDCYGDGDVYDDDAIRDANASVDVDPHQGEDGDGGSDNVELDDPEVIVDQDSEEDNGNPDDYHYDLAGNDSGLRDFATLHGGNQVHDSYDSEDTEQDSENDYGYHEDDNSDSGDDDASNSYVVTLHGEDHGHNSYHAEDREQRGKIYLEFDGASKGNPGRAGGGAVLKSEDGTVITRMRQGLGTATNNDAEYESLKSGLKIARDMGYDKIHVKGDSKLVYKQVTGKWQTRNKRMAKHCDEARQLIDQFKEFEISHHPRDQNTDADREANRAADLPEGRIFWEYNWHY
ncbi:putative carbonic anhydrase 2 [Asparagus officinalis]|uniref:putative carbonic anhydrase 2 n=1 Tax=Asparagus officinalis TaxID=4686 RepID=UPI00098DFFB4|nr:putative carbonic anhydrase 2 [Asparagus officinalis]